MITFAFHIYWDTELPFSTFYTERKKKQGIVLVEEEGRGEGHLGWLSWLSVPRVLTTCLPWRRLSPVTLEALLPPPSSLNLRGTKASPCFGHNWMNVLVRHWKGPPGVQLKEPLLTGPRTWNVPVPT